MSDKREKLQDTLCHYTKDTLLYIDTVKEFCASSADWIERRTTEISKMTDLKSSNRKPEKQQSQLEAVLEETLGGLEKLDDFLDAAERLAVTSVHVFIEGVQVIQESEGLSLEHVQAVVIAIRMICPLFLEFKRNAKAFFHPKVQNVEVLAYMLDRYIQTTQRICENLEISHLSLRKPSNIVVNLDEEFSEDDVQRMLCHINYLVDIRMDPDFRLVFLFQEVSCSGFIKQFTRLYPRMLQTLKEQEEIVTQLDSVNKGEKVTSIACSSVGLTGSGLCIAGLALAPVTAGLSAVLTVGGLSCGLVFAGFSLIKTLVVAGKNYLQLKKYNRINQRFMEDVQILHECLDEVKTQTVEIKSGLTEVAFVLGKVGKDMCATGIGIYSLVNAVSELKELKSAGRAAALESKALCNVPRVVADLPDVGQAALKGSFALSKAVRGFYIGLNVLFLGMDVFSICKDSFDLYKGSKTELSQSIQARTALWRSEMNAWKVMYDSLHKGLPMSEENIAVLFKPFYHRHYFDNLGV